MSHYTMLSEMPVPFQYVSKVFESRTHVVHAISLTDASEQDKATTRGPSLGQPNSADPNLGLAGQVHVLRVLACTVPRCNDEWRSLGFGHNID